MKSPIPFTSHAYIFPLSDDTSCQRCETGFFCIGDGLQYPCGWCDPEIEGDGPCTKPANEHSFGAYSECVACPEGWVRITKLVLGNCYRPNLHVVKPEQNWLMIVINPKRVKVKVRLLVRIESDRCTFDITGLASLKI